MAWSLCHTQSYPVSLYVTSGPTKRMIRSDAFKLEGFVNYCWMSFHLHTNTHTLKSKRNVLEKNFVQVFVNTYGRRKNTTCIWTEACLVQSMAVLIADTILGLAFRGPCCPCLKPPSLHELTQPNSRTWVPNGARYHLLLHLHSHGDP